MAHKVIIFYRLYMPYYFLGTFTEYPYLFFLCRDERWPAGAFVVGHVHVGRII